MTTQTQQPSEATQALRNELQWGYRAGIPEGVTAAWGARAILDGRTGYLDLMGDRMSSVGPAAEVDKISTALRRAEPIIHKRVETGTKKWTIAGHRAEEHVLYKTKVLTVIGNTNASHGYLYMVAFLTPKEA